MNDLTQGSVTKHILQMSGFIAISMLFQSLYFLVDLYFVSGLGKEAIAGVGVAGILNFVVMALTQMIGVGTAALIAQAVGRKDQARAEVVFNQAFVFSLATAVVVVTVCWLIRDQYTNWLGADAVTSKAALDYLNYFIPSLGLQFALIAMGSALRGTGIVKPTMAVQVLTVVLNTILAPVLIAGWGTHHPLGVTGASLSTLISVAVGVIAITLYFLKLETYVSFDTAHWAPQWEVWRAIVNIGIPPGMEFALMSVNMIVIYGIIRNFGAAAQAGFGLAGRLIMALFVPVMAVSFAALPVAGQNFGARLGDRVRKTFYSAALLGSVVMFLMTMVFQFFPSALMAPFTHDPAVLAFGGEYFRIASWNFVASGLIFTTASIFQGLGNSWPALVSSMTRLALFALPALWLSTRPGFAIHEIWYLSVATVTLQAAINIVLLHREFGRKLNFAKMVDRMVEPAGEVPLFSAMSE